MLAAKNETYDVIIIGAGISGLVCAAYLAKAGMHVLVVEQHDKPGGYCTSFKRKGFTFDAAAHALGGYREGKNFRQIIRELGVENIIKITRLNPSDIIVAPDFRITFWNDKDDTINDLTRHFPHEKENIHKFYEYFNGLASSNQFHNANLKDKTFDSLLRTYFSDDKLISAISYPVFGYGGLPPTLMHAFTGDALAQIVEQNSGSLLYKRHVKKILYKNMITSGVELNTGQTIASKYVVSAGDITQTFTALLGTDIVDKQILDKLNNFIPAISSFILYIGLEKHQENLPYPGTNIWHLPNYDPDGIFRSMTNSDRVFSESYMFRVSPDKKTIMAVWFSQFKTVEFWKQYKKEIASVLLGKIEEKIPHLKKHISYFEAATPYTLHRYTLNHHGANYGWAPLQSQLFEPVFSRVTAIKGLYLTGHWTAQAHGIPGVAYVGYNTAKLILKREQSHSQP
jgi:phytoene dehydrogenase-like protein